jgi:hypothetical protein
MPTAPRRARMSLPLAEESPPDDMKKALNQTGANESKIALYIENEERLSQYDFVDEFPAESFNLVKIQARYGPGQYRAIFYDNNDEEVRKVEFGIAARPDSENDDKDDDKFDRLITVLMERESNRNTGQAPQSTGLSATEILLPIILKLLDNKNGADPLAQFAAMATILKGSTGGGIDPLTMMTQLREEREAGMKLGERIAGAAEGEGGFWPTAVRELSPAIMAIASRATNTPALGSPVVPAQIAAPANAIPDNLSWLLPLRGYLPVLVQKARQGKSPEVYADFLIEEMNAEQHAKLEVSAKEADFVETMMRAVTDFQAPELQQWGRNFLLQIRSHFVTVESDVNNGDTEEVAAAIARAREEANGNGE